MGTVRYTVIDGEIIAEKRNGVRKQYVPDSLGSTVALLDNTQTQTDTFSYWPYGEVASRTGTTPTPFQYVGTAGYRQDSASKTYVRARTLNTQLGKWLTQDPIGFRGDDFNLYRYANNNITTYTDASGLASGVWVCGKAPPLGHQFISTNLCGAWGFDSTTWSRVGAGTVGNCDLYLRPTYPGDLKCPSDHNSNDPTDPKFPHIPGAGVKGGRGGNNVKCDLISTNSNFESEICKCINRSKKFPGPYLNPYIRIRNCNTWVDEILDCACKGTGYDYWSQRYGGGCDFYEKMYDGTLGP